MRLTVPPPESLRATARSIARARRPRTTTTRRRSPGLARRRCARTRARVRRRARRRSSATGARRHRVQPGLFDAIAEPAKAIAGRVQRARRARHVAQHPDVARRPRSAPMLAGKLVREALLHRGERERTQRVAVDAWSATRAPAVRAARSAWPRPASGHNAQAASTSASARGQCSAACMRAPTLQPHDAPLQARETSLRCIQRQHRDAHRGRARPDRSPRAHAALKPAGRASSATSTLLRSTLPASTIAPTHAARRTNARSRAPRGRGRRTGGEVRQPRHLHARARRIDDHELPVHHHRRAAARGVVARQLQAPALSCAVSTRSGKPSVELQRRDPRQRQHHQPGERQTRLRRGPPGEQRAGQRQRREQRSQQRRHAGAPARRWRPARIAIDSAEPAQARRRAQAVAVPHHQRGHAASASRPSGSSEPSTARCTRYAPCGHSASGVQREPVERRRGAPDGSDSVWASDTAACRSACRSGERVAGVPTRPCRAARAPTARKPGVAPACSAPRRRRSAPALRRPRACSRPRASAAAGPPAPPAALRAHHLVDRDEAGVLREQAVLQAERGDRARAGVWPPFSASSSPSCAMRWRAHRCAAPPRRHRAPARRRIVGVAAARRCGLRGSAWRLAARRATCRTPPPGGRPARRAADAGSTSYTSRPVEARLQLRQHRRVDHAAQALGLLGRAARAW